MTDTCKTCMELKPTNCSRHERLFSYQRKSTPGNTVPSWLSISGPVFLKCHVRQSKFDPAVEGVDFLEANPEYAFVQLENDSECTVSLRDLAPCQKEDHLVSPTENI